MDSLIHDRGRGPEIRGSRITVYDVLDYHKNDWTPEAIAELFRLEPAQIRAAIAYIDGHRDAVMAEYRAMLDRDARGNPPEVQAKLDEAHAYFQKLLEIQRRDRGRFLALMDEFRRDRSRYRELVATYHRAIQSEAAGAGTPG